MKKEIETPENFKERSRIISGRIYQGEMSPEYGAIFTVGGSQDDLDTSLIFGALIENVRAPQDETDRYFEIKGGYFHNKRTGTTTKVFGIVAESPFDITEGGQTKLHPNFKVDNPDNPKIDESKAAGSGWTFVVDLKEAEKYPRSGGPLKIVVFCPRVETVSAIVSDCVTDPKDGLLKRKVTFKAKSDEIKPASWIWHFGDGTSSSQSGIPPKSVDHLYSDMPGEVPKLCLEGDHLYCSEICKEVSLSEFEPCIPCAKMVGINHVITDKDEETKSVEFTIFLTQDSGAPDKFEWEWGDGSPKAVTTAPLASHDYKIPENGTTQYKIEVSSVGPGECRDVSHTYLEISALPPKLTHIIDINWPHGGEVSLHKLREQMGGQLRIRVDRRLLPTDDIRTGINRRTFTVQYSGIQRYLEFLSSPEEEEPHLSEDGYTAIFPISPVYLEGRYNITGAFIFVSLRCDFVLDCDKRPVDGNYCRGCLPSGDGRPGGEFVSWFRVVHE